MILIHDKLKKHMAKKNLNIIKISLEIVKGGWCAGKPILQVEAIKEIQNESGFTKYDADGIDVYISNGLELSDEIEIKYVYSLPIIGTVLSASGIKIKD